MLRFLADENFPGDAVRALREAGHDVVSVRENSPGVSDPIVLRQAVEEQRVLLTFDKDFGELAFRTLPPARCGVILFRMPPCSPGELSERITRALASRSDWAAPFTVIDERRIRMRRVR